MAKKQKKSKLGKLTLKQKKFVDKLHSMKEPNQRIAYESAYKCRGHVAEVEAGRVLRKPLVAAYHQKLKEKATERAQKSANEIIAELEKIGFSNIKDFIGDNNEIQDISQISRGKAAAVESIQSDIRYDSGDSEGYTEKVKLKLYDKKSALVDLGKRYGIFPNKTEHTGGDGGPIQISIVDFGSIDDTE